jgi:YD repeat-containing protein
MLKLGDPDPKTFQELRDALDVARKHLADEGLPSLTRFLETHPDSPWRASIMANLAALHRRRGRLSEAMKEAEHAWALCRESKHPNAGPVGDQALGELLELYSRVGNRVRLQSLLDEIGARKLRGVAAQKAVTARRRLSKMIHQVDTSFQCGPMALAALAPFRGQQPIEPRRPQEARSTDQGTSLAQNLDWASKWELGLQAAKRSAGSAVLVPALVHWKTGHYSALVEARGGRYHVLDRSFDEDVWITAAALDDESTGYALVPWGKLPEGWQTVGEKEAADVWGKGDVGLGPIDGPFPGDDIRPLQAPSGRARYGVYPVYSSLTVTDPVLSYRPPRGYPVVFQLTYHQRFTYQPQTFTHAHVGPNWTFGWVSYIEDDPAIPQATVSLYTSEGGRHTFTGYDAATGTFSPQLRTRERLIRTGPSRYEHRMADGSLEVFEHAGEGLVPRRVFLTQRVDSSGNGMTLEYDGMGRICAVKDALGQATTLTYGEPGDPYRLTVVTDPFGRKASLTYSPEGQLAKVTDAAGLSYSYAYGPDARSPEAPADFLRLMTTPYGDYTFSTKEEGVTRWVEILDPLGAKERMEFRNDAPGVAFVDKVIPPLGSNNQYLSRRNGFFWDRKAMALHAGDYNQAEVLHYIHGATMSVVSSLLASEKKPLENRVWYRYPDMPNNISQGTGSHPSQAGRTLSPGVFDIQKATYNEWGKPTRTEDPQGRVHTFHYSSNGIDLLKVTEGEGVAEKPSATYAYDDHHRVVRAKDDKGEVVQVAYNAYGQVTALTGRGQRMVCSYDAKGFLTHLEAHPRGPILDFTYDALGRIQTLGSKGKGRLRMSYDALDRLTQIQHADGTRETWTYDRYDLAESRNRKGRVCRVQRDVLRRPTSIEEAPGGKSWKLDWSLGGGLLSLQAKGEKPTLWERDLQDRMTAKRFPDGKRVDFTYDVAGRRAGKLAARETKGSGTRLIQPAPTTFQAKDLITFLAVRADDHNAKPRLGKGMPGDEAIPSPGAPWEEIQARLQTLQDPRAGMDSWCWVQPQASEDPWALVPRR